mgnify:CR=1 FL=1
MNFLNTVKAFVANESGAVTVDWVVLTAAIVGLGLAVVTSVRSGVSSLGTSISSSLSGASVASLGTLGSSGTTTTPSN